MTNATQDQPSPVVAVDAMSLPVTTPALQSSIDHAQKLDVASFDAARRTRLQQIVDSTPGLDQQTILSFGADVQMRANAALDELIDGIRTYEAGSSGAMIAEFSTGLKMVDIPGLKREAESVGSFVKETIGKIPLLGAFLIERHSAFERLKANQTKIKSFFDKIETRARTEMATLLAIDSKMERLIEQNIESLRELAVYVGAGQTILEREKARFEEARKAALASNDPVQLTAVCELAEKINAFETRLLRVHVAMQDAMSAIPQTRLAQSAGRIEHQNIMDTLLFDIPRVKSAIIRLSSLKAITDASNASDARRKLAQSLTQSGVEALDLAYTRAKESQHGALAEIVALGQVADKILGIDAKGAQIDSMNSAQRKQALELLSRVRENFTKGLAANAAKSVSSS